MELRNNPQFQLDIFFQKHYNITNKIILTNHNMQKKMMTILVVVVILLMPVVSILL